MSLVLLNGLWFARLETARSINFVVRTWGPNALLHTAEQDNFNRCRSDDNTAPTSKTRQRHVASRNNADYETELQLTVTIARNNLAIIYFHGIGNKHTSQRPALSRIDSYTK